MKEIGITSAARCARWYREAEKTFGGRLEETIALAADADSGRISRSEEAYKQLLEIESRIEKNEFGYREMGTDEFRFRNLKRKITALRLRLAFEKLRRGSAHRMANGQKLIESAQIFWEINRIYVNTGAAFWRMAGITRDEYYAVLVKVDLALE